MAQERTVLAIVDDLRQMRTDFREAADVVEGLDLETFDNAESALQDVRKKHKAMVGMITDLWILKDDTQNSTGDPRYDPYPYAMDILDGMQNNDIVDVPVIAYTRFKKGDFQGSTEEYIAKAKARFSFLLTVEEFHTDSRRFLKRAVGRFERFHAYGS